MIRQQRRNDGLTTKTVALTFLLAASFGVFVNLLVVKRYHTKKDEIYLTHLEIIFEDDVVPSEHDGWEDDDDKKSSSVVAKTPELLSPSSFSGSCFKARNNTVPEHLYGKLTKPYLNLGLPKTGTSSLHNFFECGGLSSAHYRCSRLDSCARCIRQSVEAGGRPLELCTLSKKYDVYSQMDDGIYFPQIELLDEIVAAYPKATLFLTFRSVEKWYNSMKNWPPRKRGPHMVDKLRKENITGFPSGVGENIDEFGDWYCKHVERVRDIVARNPSIALVEVDIEDPSIAKRMSKIFEIDESCWGHSNVNPISNPDLDLSGVQLSRKFVEFNINKKDG